jgi:hypothetical protein
VSHRQDLSTAAWAEAVCVHTHLLANGHLTAVDTPVPGLTPEPAEYAVGVLQRASGVTLEYARYYAANVVYTVGGPAVVVGSPQFLTGFILGSTIRHARMRRRAQRQAAPQWRPALLLCAVVTTRRLWCEVAETTGPRWLNFNYDTITSLNLTGNALTLTFQQSEPLSLAGDGAPWCAAVIAHYHYGPAAAAVLPSLHDAAVR